MSRNRLLKPASQNTSISDISLNWQANWDSSHLYLSFSVRDDDLEKGDELLLTLDASKDTETNDNKKFITISSAEKEADTDSSNDTNTSVNEEDKDKEEDKSIAKTYVFSPFDNINTINNNGSQTHLTRTTLGYILNVAIPWSEIYHGKRTPKTGNKIGINIKVTDVDEDERGSQTLYLSTQNKALPELELNY